MNAAVEAVDDQDIAVGVKGQTGRAVQLSFATSRLAPTLQEVAMAVEHRHLMEPLVCCIDVVVCVHGHGGQVGKPADAKFYDVLVVQRRLGDAGVAPAGDEHGPVASNRHADGLAEPLACRLPHADVVAVLPAAPGTYCDQGHVSPPNSDIPSLTCAQPSRTGTRWLLQPRPAFRQPGCRRRLRRSSPGPRRC